MAPRNTRATHPAVSQQIEQMLKARSIDFDFEPNIQIAQIRDAEGNQVRLTEHRAPKEQVAKYATAMKHGASFPAIVLNDRMEKIDGNTRLAARIKNGDDTIAAYICHGMTPLQARSLSVELNQSNGLAMTDEEIRRFIDGAVLEGQDPEVRTLARMTGVRETKISRWIAETEFMARAERDEIEERHINALPPSTRAALQVTRLAAVFRALTVLAAEARIPAAKVKKIVAAANGAASEADALAIVENERTARADEIRAVASGFSPRDDRRSKGSAQHLGGLAKFEVEDLLDVAPEKRFETFQRLKLVSDRLTEVVSRAEREWDLTPPVNPIDESQIEKASSDDIAAGAHPVAAS
jgi:hypothetical protein